MWISQILICPLNVKGPNSLVALVIFIWSYQFSDKFFHDLGLTIINLFLDVSACVYICAKKPCFYQPKCSLSQPSSLCMRQYLLTEYWHLTCFFTFSVLQLQYIQFMECGRCLFFLPLKWTKILQEGSILPTMVNVLEEASLSTMIEWYYCLQYGFYIQPASSHCNECFL